MKSAIPWIVLLFTIFNYSQDTLVQPDPTTYEEARAFSKEGELVVFVIAGREFNSKSDAEITQNLKQITSKVGLRLNVFIQRTDKRYSSSYFTFKEGKVCSDRKTSRSGLAWGIGDCLGRLTGSLRDPE